MRFSTFATLCMLALPVSILCPILILVWEPSPRKQVVSVKKQEVSKNNTSGYAINGSVASSMTRRNRKYLIHRHEYKVNGYYVGTIGNFIYVVR